MNKTRALQVLSSLPAKPQAIMSANAVIQAAYKLGQEVVAIKLVEHKIRFRIRVR